MNYAGRLNPNLAEQKTVGYVYPILNFAFDVDKTRVNDQKNLWCDLKRKVDKPDVIFSQYLNIPPGFWSFYILSLFVNSSLRNSFCSEISRRC